jgi:hypothetical protein
MTEALCYSAVSANRTSCLTPQPKRRRVLVACLSLCAKTGWRLSVPCTHTRHGYPPTLLPEGSTMLALQHHIQLTVGPSTTSHSQIISASFFIMFSSRVLSGLATERFPTDYHATSVNAFLLSTTHLQCPTVKTHGGLVKSRIPTSPSRISREAPYYHA